MASVVPRVNTISLVDLALMNLRTFSRVVFSLGLIDVTLLLCPHTAILLGDTSPIEWGPLPNAGEATQFI